MRLKRAVFLLLAIFTNTAFVVIPASSGPPYYHEEGNVNYSGSYFESTYISRGIGIDDYITLIDLVLVQRAWGTDHRWPEGIGWHKWNPDADIDGDGEVWVTDLYSVGFNYGLNYHDTTPFEYEEQAATKVKIDPSKVQTDVGQNFTIDIEIKSVDGLNLWEAKIWWSQGLLELIDIVQGDFLNQSTTFNYISDSNYLYVCAGGGKATQSGDGTLATVTFKCNATGTTPINLSSRLFDIDLYSIPHKDYSGESKQSN